jgi:hypothetical protein
MNSWKSQGRRNDIHGVGVVGRGQAPGAEIGVAHGFDLLNRVPGGDFVKRPKTEVDFLDELFGAELFADLSEPLEVGEHHRHGVVRPGR